MYIINPTRLSPTNTPVTIIRQDLDGVVLVDNGVQVHSTRMDNLSDTPIVVEEVVIKPIDLFNQI